MRPEDLQEDDKITYEFLLQTNPTAAQTFLEKKSAEKGIGNIFAPKDVEETVQPQSIYDVMASQRILPTAFPGLVDRQQYAFPPDTKTETEVRNLIAEQRHLTTPTEPSLIKQREQSLESTAKQYERQGYPSERSQTGQIPDLYQKALREWEANNGGIPLIMHDFETQVRVENELKTHIQNRLMQMGVPTAEEMAKETFMGEFGPLRPRQAGSPYDFRPTFDLPIPSQSDVAGQLAKSPEKAREMSGVEAIFESILPQTLVSAEEVQAQQRYKDQISADKRAEVINRLADEGVYMSDYNLPQQNDLINKRILDDYNTLYDDMYTFGFQQSVDRGMNRNEAAEVAKRLAAIMVRNDFEKSIPQDDPKWESLKSDFYDTYGIAALGYDPYIINDSLVKGGTQFLQDLLTEPSPATGEITESSGMWALRNIGTLPFRFIANPFEEVLENTILYPLGGGEAGQKSYYIDENGEKQYSIYDLPTYDFTEETSWFAPWDTFNAYLREVAVENARAYTMGNALSNYTTNPVADDVLFIGGTIAEGFTPIGSLVGYAGSGMGNIASKVAKAKGLQTTTKAILKTAQETGSPNLAAALADDIPTLGFKDLAEATTVNKQISHQAAQQVASVDAARQYAALVEAGQYEDAIRLYELMEHDKTFIASIPDEIGIHAVDDINQKVIARKSVVEGAPPETSLPGQRPQYDPLRGEGPAFTPDVMETANLEQVVADFRMTAGGVKSDLNKFLQQTATLDNIYGDTANVIIREGRSNLPYVWSDELNEWVPFLDNGVPGLGSPMRSGASLEEIIEPAAERLATKYDLDKYVALTTRMGIEAEVAKKILPEIYETVTAPLQQETYKISADSLRKYFGGKTFRRDAELRRIADKASAWSSEGGNDILRLAPEEQMYLTERMIEREAREALKEEARGALFPITRKAAEAELKTPEARRGVLFGQKIGQMITEYVKPKKVIEGISSTDIGKVAVDKVKKWTRTTAPEGDVVLYNRALQEATDSVVQLERSLPKTVSKYGQLSETAGTPAERAEQVAFNIWRSSTVDDPTRVLAMSDDVAKQFIANTSADKRVMQHEVNQILKGIFYNIQNEDLQRIASYMAKDEATGALYLESISDLNLIIEDLNRVNRLHVPDKTISIPKTLLGLSMDNTAKQRVALATRKELSNVSVPAIYSSPEGYKALVTLGQESNLGNLEPLYQYGYEGAKARGLLTPNQIEFFDTLMSKNQQRIDTLVSQAEQEMINSLTTPPAPTSIGTGLAERTRLPLTDAQAQQVREMSDELRKYLNVQSEIDITNDILDMQNKLRARGLAANMTPEQSTKEFLDNVRFFNDSTLAVPATTETSKILDDINRLANSEEGLMQLQSNMKTMSKKELNMYNRLAAGMGHVRRSWVSGQLGGKYAPNIPYLAENYMTAPIIASVTAPDTFFQYVAKPYFNKNITGGTVSRLQTLAHDPGRANDVIPGTRYTYGQINHALETRHFGSSSGAVQMNDIIFNDIDKAMNDAIAMGPKAPGYRGMIQQAGQELKSYYSNPSNYGLSQTTSSPWMQLSIETDFAYRRQMFLGAILDGKTIDEATDLAQNAFLDYGKMPPELRKGYAKNALYLSFLYATQLEAMKAMMRPKSAQRLAQLSKYHVDMAKATGSYNYVGDQALQSVWLDVNEGDGNWSSVNTYYRDPWMSNMIMSADAFTYLLQAAQGDPEATFSRGMEGIVEMAYVPALDVLKNLDPDYKKGAPPKLIYDVLVSQSIGGNIPDIFSSVAPDALGPESVLPVRAAVPGIRSLQGGQYFVDRYDLEVRPMANMAPEAPMYNRYQYNFRTPEGYNRFVWDTSVMTAMGTKRLNDDIVGTLIAAGIVPEGTEFGYLENGNPVLYMFGRQRVVPVPPSWAMKDMMLRQQQRKLKEMDKMFGEPTEVEMK